jgi:hypothetical protein
MTSSAISSNHIHALPLCAFSLPLIEESEDGLIDGLRDRSIDMIQLIEELFLH